MKIHRILSSLLSYTIYEVCDFSKSSNFSRKFVAYNTAVFAYARADLKSGYGWHGSYPSGNFATPHASVWQLMHSSAPVDAPKDIADSMSLSNCMQASCHCSCEFRKAIGNRIWILQCDMGVFVFYFEVEREMDCIFCSCLVSKFQNSLQLIADKHGPFLVFQVIVIYLQLEGLSLEEGNVIAFQERFQYIE